MEGAGKDEVGVIVAADAAPLEVHCKPVSGEEVGAEDGLLHVCLFNVPGVAAAVKLDSIQVEIVN